MNRDGQFGTPSTTPVPEFLDLRPADRLLAGLRAYMQVHASESDQDRVRAVGDINEPLAENIERIREFLKNAGYAALFRVNPGDRQQAAGRHVVLFGPAHVRAPARSRPVLNVVLFVLTVFTTLFIGSLQQGGNPFFLRDLAYDSHTQAHFWRVLWESLGSGNPLKLGELLLGVPFSAALILILGSHELGHYLTARRHGVDATLPYFLPIPHPLMGTMGAFIRIKSPIPNRRALVRLGVAGPLTGFLVAVPIVVVGLLLSHPVPKAQAEGSLTLGSSLLFGGLSQLLFPRLPPGWDVSLHPLAFAGWLGFFVTALNLIPLGQLDGGHIAYVALGRFRTVFRFAVLAGMVGLGFLWSGWFFWAVLVFLLGLGHPPTEDEITPLRRGDWLLVIAAAVVMILTFIPVPFPRAGI